MRTFVQQYAIFEREPRMNAKPNDIIFGPCLNEEEATNALVRYGYANDDNYYVAAFVYDKVKGYVPLK